MAQFLVYFFWDQWIGYFPWSKMKTSSKCKLSSLTIWVSFVHFNTATFQLITKNNASEKVDQIISLSEFFFPGTYTWAYIYSWNLRMTCVSWDSCQDRHSDSRCCTRSIINVTYFKLIEDNKVKMRTQTPQCLSSPACTPRAQFCHKLYITVFKVHRNAFTMINNSLYGVLRSCNDSL